MKLSTSSSFFLASLALSSSSSTLAAPARDPTESGLSVSSSSHDVFDSSVHSAAHCSAHRTQPQPTPVEGNSGAVAARSTPSLPSLRDTLVTLGQVVEPLPLVGSTLKALLTALAGDIPSPLAGQNLAETDGVSVQGLSTEDMAALQAAIQQVTQALNNTVVSKAPSPVKSVASGLPIPVAQSDFDPAGGSAAASAAPGSPSAMSSAQPSPTPSAVVNDVPSSSSPSRSAATTPPSPVVPVNPPNSPTLPIHLPF